MIEFINKTEEQNGTPINRETMMALQGFISQTTRIDENGNIVESNSRGETKTTVFNADGSIVETLTGEKEVVKITTFSDGVITEMLTAIE